MTTTKPELKAYCAHLRVRYRTVEQGSGLVSGHWECDDCFTEFVPRAAAPKVLEDADCNLDKYGRCKNYKCTGSYTETRLCAVKAEPVINDVGLAEAVEKLKSGRALFDDGKPYMQGAMISIGFSKSEMESLINHALKGEKLAEALKEIENLAFHNTLRDSKFQRGTLAYILSVVEQALKDFEGGGK